MRQIVSTVMLVMFSAACGPSFAPTDARSGEEPTGSLVKEERWSRSDRPSIFSTDLEYRFAELPLSGEAARTPWPGSGWPTQNDSINSPWSGPSATERYQQAFGRTNLEDQLSGIYGIDAHTDRKACTSNAECPSGSQCGIRAGRTNGHCIPDWFGICHGWAPAAILVPEPQRPVTRNGVEFRIQDMKALISLLHTRNNIKFVSLRCNANDSNGGIEYDENGRAESNACRDTNAGTFHLLLANYLGKLKQSFIIDMSFDYQVWNQPLRSFYSSTRAITAEEANELIGVAFTGGRETSYAGHIETGLTHVGSVAIAEGERFEATFTGTQSYAVIKFGAPPTAEDFDCYAASYQACVQKVPAGVTEAFVAVYSNAADDYTVKVTAGATVPSTYAFNPDATTFVAVETSVGWVRGTANNDDGYKTPQIDSYTGYQQYNYVLELDAAGKVIGGEWIGYNKRSHPDFAWLPLSGRAAAVVNGQILYSDVKSLIDESLVTPARTDTRAIAQQLSGSVKKDDVQVFGPFAASGGTFSATLDGDGDADLYVQKGSAPTFTSYECRPYRSGSRERCEAAEPSAYYVLVHGASETRFTLDVAYQGVE